MHCTTAHRLLQAYIDRQLSLEQLRTLEWHLSICTACQRELRELEEISQALCEIEVVEEPANLTATIMQRVASTPQHVEEAPFILHISFVELLSVVILATIATLGVILGLPSLREALPFANGLSLMTLHLTHSLTTVNSETLMLAFWIIGTILGVWITLALAGREMRRMEWFRSVIDRLPVW